MSYSRAVGLLLLGIVLGQSAPAISQSPPSVEVVGNRPLPADNLPADFIDSRPILAHFGDRPMPDTVRALLEYLKRPDACGDAEHLQKGEVCAVVFYKLDDDITPDRFRPPLIMRAIYRISEPENLADTVMLMPDKTGDLQRYTGGRLFEPMRDVRANICRRDARMPEQCTATENKGILYRPIGILGKRENDREQILPADSAKKHFFLDVAALDRDWLKRQQARGICLQMSVRMPSLLAC